MRPVLIALLALCACAAPAAAQTTGPTGPAVPGPTPPGAGTVGSADVGQSVATVKGSVDPNNGETQVQFQYGTSTSYGLTTPTQTLPAGDGATDVQAALSRLTIATTYHYRVVATNAAGVTRGGDKTFKTASAPSKPAVASVAAKDIAFDAATLQARVDANRQETSYVFEYGTSSTRFGATTAPVSVGAGDSGVPVAVRVGGLASNQKYYFRLKATNASGTTTGGTRSFTTAKVALGLAASVSPSIVRYSRTLTVMGTVTGTDKRGVPVQLQRRNFPFDAGFTPSGNQQLTDGNGVVRFLVPPFTLASQFRLVAPSRGNLTSNVATVQVRALVRLRIKRLRGGRLRLSGTVAPANARGLVSIQRRGSTGRYAAVKRVALRQTKGVGRFTAVVRTRKEPSIYRAATRLTGGALVDGRSPIIRVRGGR